MAQTLKIPVTQILLQSGFERSTEESLLILTDLLIHFLSKISKTRQFDQTSYFNSRIFPNKKLLLKNLGQIHLLEFISYVQAQKKIKFNFQIHANRENQSENLSESLSENQLEVPFSEKISLQAKERKIKNECEIFIQESEQKLKSEISRTNSVHLVHLTQSQSETGNSQLKRMKFSESGSIFKTRTVQGLEPGTETVSGPDILDKLDRQVDEKENLHHFTPYAFKRGPNRLILSKREYSEFQEFRKNNNLNLSESLISDELIFWKKYTVERE